MEELFRRLMEFTGDGVYCYTFDDGTIVFANQGYADILELDCSPEEIIGKPLTELMVYTEKEGTVRRALNEQGEIHRFPYHFKTLKGHEKWVLHDSFIAEDPATHVKVVQAIVKDVTASMQAEEALAHEHNLLRTLIDNLPDPTYFKDVESRFIVANAAVAELMGVKRREDLLGMTDFDCYPKELADKFYADEQDTIRSGQPLFGREELVIDAAGNRRWFLTTKVPIRGTRGEIVGIVGIGRDITKHRQVEEALVEALQRFESVIENTPLVAIQGFDRDGVIRHWNAACTTLYGYTAEQALGRRVQDLILSGESAQAFKDLLHEMWVTGKATVPQEWRVRTRDGQERWAYSTIFPIFERGKVAEGFCMDVDITERKCAEEALRLDESRLEALLKLEQFTAAPLQEITDFALEEGIRLTGSTVGYLAFLNEDETVLTLYSWSKTAMQECHIADKPLIYPVETTGLWGEVVRQRRPIITNDYAAPNPWKKGYPEGHVQLTRHMNVPIFDGDHIVLVAGVGNKLTDYDESDVRQLTLLATGMWRIIQRKRAEDALRDSEVKYRTLADNTHDWEFWLGPDGDFRYVSPSCHRVTGYEAKEFEADPKLLLRIVHQDDVSALADHVRGEAAREAPGPLEFRIVDADGHEKWIEHTCRPVYDGEGRYLGARGSNRDITDRKRVEQHLTALNECFLDFTPNADENIQRLVELCGELTGATCALYNRVENGLLHTKAGWRVPPDFRLVDHPKGHICYDVILRGGDDVFLVQRLPQTVYAQTDPAVAQYGLKTYAGQPVRCSGETVGALCVVYQDDFTPSETDTALLGIIAQAITVEEQRKLAEAARRDGESRLKIILQSLLLGILTVDAETHEILDANEKALEMIGATRDEVVGRVCHQFVCPAGEGKCPVTDLGQAIDNSERVLRRADGETIPIIKSIVPVMLGKRTVLIESFLDISERKRAERALRESEDKYHTLFRVFPDGIFLERLDGSILDCNPSAHEMYGYTREELIGLTVADLVPVEFVAQLPRVAEELSKGRLFTEAHGKRKNGEVFPVEVSAQMLTVGGERLALVHVRDITERKRADEERRELEMKIQQAQKLESLGVLAGGIAHDFNNLLTGILGHASLALMELSPVSPARDSVKQIEVTSRRAAELTKQMLAYAGKGRFVIQSIHLSEVVEEMAHLLEVSISKKSVLRYNLAKDLPAIEADVTQIRQVIMNLIINASEAIGEKSGVIRVTTGAMSCDRNYLSDTYLNEDLSEGQYVYVEVADTGCGMSPETKAKLFDPFFTTKFTGRGLGLAALLGIIRGHRGAVKVYSELGRGSTFKVLLPAAPGATRPVAIPTTLAETLRGSGVVLVVDDEEIVLGLAREVLGDAGFTVYTASDGEQALDLFRQHAHEIQVVLLDLTMPHMDGLETFTDMRRIRNDVRVILSSGYNEQDATEQFAGKGLTGFIHKPYVAQDLIQIVCKVMAIEVKGKDRSATTRRSPRRRKKG